MTVISFKIAEQKRIDKLSREVHRITSSLVDLDIQARDLKVSIDNLESMIHAASGSTDGGKRIRELSKMLASEAGHLATINLRRLELESHVSRQMKEIEAVRSRLAALK